MPSKGKSGKKKSGKASGGIPKKAISKRSQVKVKPKPKTKTKEKFSPVPEDFGTVTPYLVINGAAQALDFYKRAFGAEELDRQTTPDGKIMHGRLRIGDSIVLLADEFPGSGSRAPSSIGTTTITLHIYSDDVDRLWERALAAGARIAMNLDNTFWGERYGQLVDPFGHRWSISMRIKMDPKEMEEKRRAAMEMFASGEHLAPEATASESDQGEMEKPAAAGVG
jgi:PhnB protein